MSILLFSVSEFDVLFFCRDGRILPSLGQQTFAMIELEGPNFVRLYNMKDRVRGHSLKNDVIGTKLCIRRVISSGNLKDLIRWWMLKGPPANPRDYISRTSKISRREGALICSKKL